MAWGNEHHLTAGMTATYAKAPIYEFRGSLPTDDTAITLLDALRTSSYLAFFAENQFKFGRFSIIPAVRYETVHQELTDNVRLKNDAGLGFPNQPLRQRADNQNVPLGALGLAFDLTNTSNLYFNLSQGYKPPTYGDALPRNSNVTNTDLDAGHTLTYELGYRGKPFQFMNWDVSGFFIDYQDRFGTVGSGTGQTVQNVGQSQNWGIDFAGEVDLIALTAGDQAELATKRFGNLAFHVAYEWLNASFVDGPLDGRKPQYSPENLFRFGLTYRWRDRFKISLLHTYVSQHYANDSNDANFGIPAYHVTDLTAEAKVWKDNVTVLAGINNLFDQDYYSRIRATGIEPAYGRNFYVGVRFNY
jgi:Fe(3+) dicitrate transport protein